MGAWLAQAGPIAVAVVVLLVPGLLIGAALRLRGLALWAFAPVVSTAAVAALAVLYGLARVPWSALSAGVGVLALAGLAALVGLALGRAPRKDRDGSVRRPLALALTAGMAVGAARLMMYVGDPEAISQTNDGIFHLNALRWVQETANASSFNISGVVGGRGFYPGAWHGLASLVASATGCDIPVAANAVSWVIAVVVWTLGVTWLCFAVSGSPLVAAFGAVLAPSLLTFPLLSLQWGVLYPYALSVALLPAATAAALTARGGIQDSLPDTLRPVRSRAATGVRTGILCVIAAAALALAQPATLIAWGLLASLYATWSGVGALRGRDARGRVAIGVGVVACWASLAVAWYLLGRLTSGAHWEPFRGKLAATLDVLFNGQMWLPPAYGVSLLCAIGILVVIVRRRRDGWLVAGWLAFGLLYIAAAAVGSPFLRNSVLAAWYSDPYRFASLAPVVVLPLAAIGLAATVTWSAAAISPRTSAERTGTAWAIGAVAGAGVIGLVVAPVIMMPNVFEGRVDGASRYSSTADSFLSPDERALLSALGDYVAPGDRVIANPSTGAAYGYMLSGRDVYPRTWQPGSSDAWWVVAGGLRDVAEAPNVCPTLAQLGSPDYVLDFGPGEASPGRWVMPGMTDFADRPGFELVAERGDASLWRITACGS